MKMWQSQGNYEYEYDHSRERYTGWCRCVGGRMADGRWPQFNNQTGETR